MNEKRFVDHDTSVEDYVESLENRNTKEKTKRDVKLLETFLRNEKNDEREVHDIEPAELNKIWSRRLKRSKSFPENVFK